MRTKVKIFSFLVKALVAITTGVIFLWFYFFGIYNDNNLVFRFINFFGYYVPVLWLFGVFFLYIANYKLLCIFYTLIYVPIIITIYNLYFSEVFQPEHQDHKAELMSFVSYSKMSRNKSYSEISNIIDCSKYDVIVVQEIPDFFYFVESEFFKNNCHYDFDAELSKAVFSKFPIHNIGRLASNQYVSININGEEVHVLNVRLDKAIFNSDVQRTQVVKLVDFIESHAGKLVVAGDFNSSDFNESIYRIKKVIESANDKGADGFGFTFPAPGRSIGRFFPLIRIDYIFYSGLKIKKSYVFPESFGSDHYPVFSLFSIK